MEMNCSIINMLRTKKYNKLTKINFLKHALYK